MITLISATNRPQSYSKRVADIYKSILDEKQIPNQLLSLEDLPKDFIFSQLEDQTDDYIGFAKKYIEQAHKFIFIIADYNGSFPGILKAFVDTVPPKMFRGKKSCLVGVSSGHLGAVRGMDHFTDILHYLGVEVLSNKPKFSNIENLLNTNDQFIDTKNHQRLLNQLEMLERFF